MRGVREEAQKANAVYWIQKGSPRPYNNTMVGNQQRGLSTWPGFEEGRHMILYVLLSRGKEPNWLGRPLKILGAEEKEEGEVFNFHDTSTEAQETLMGGTSREDEETRSSSRKRRMDKKCKSSAWSSLT